MPIFISTSISIFLYLSDFSSQIRIFKSNIFLFILLFFFSVVNIVWNSLILAKLSKMVTLCISICNSLSYNLKAKLAFKFDKFAKIKISFSSLCNFILTVLKFISAPKYICLSFSFIFCKFSWFNFSFSWNLYDIFISVILSMILFFHSI